MDGEKVPAKKVFTPLPKTAKPKIYDLTIDTNVDEFAFNGTLNVHIDILQEKVSELILNSDALKVSKASLTQSQTSSDATISYDESNSWVIFKFEKEFSVGEAVLHVEYSGSTKDRLTGYYSSPDLSNEGRYCAVTQFEATYARSAFPCWDEPEIKAQFDITMIADEEYTVLSNMNQISSNPLSSQHKQRKVVKFARTPIMSTYLLAFSVGLYDYAEATDSNGVLHRVYGGQGKQEQFKFALDFSIKSLELLTSFFKIKFPLPKIDHLGVASFDFGAMENWGLVTYRMQYLIVDAIKSSGRLKQTVLLIVAHELSHQWFGNLVTMKWWTDLWLNEGFANFMEYYIVDHYQPDYEMWCEFVEGEVIRSMELDSLRNSHPIEVEVRHPDEIVEIFDAISYSKGASLNRMLFHFIGQNNFQTGLTNYLNHFAYKNASTSDLWKFLGEASGIDLVGLAESWSKQMGFPVVTVEESTQVGDQKRVLKLTQKRHIADGRPDDKNTLWNIPISVIAANSNGKPLKQFVMKERCETIELEGVGVSDWIHLNPDFVGIYIVQYPEDNLSLLRKSIETASASNEMPSLSAESRLSVLFDLLCLAFTGQVSFSSLLETVNGFKNEKNTCVWRLIVMMFSKLAPIFVGSNCSEEKVKKFKTSLFANIMQHVGLKNVENAGGDQKESHLRILLRSLLIGQAGKIGHEETIKYCRELVEAQLNRKEDIPSEIRSSALVTVALNASSVEEVDNLISLYRSSSSIEEKMSVLECLGQCQKEQLALHVLNFTLSKEVLPSNLLFLYRSFSRNYKLGHVLWKFFEDNYDAISVQFYGSQSVLSVLKSVTTPFYSTDQINKMDEFFSKNPVKAFDRTYAQNKETIQINAQCIERDGIQIKEYFDRI